VRIYDRANNAICLFVRRFLKTVMFGLVLYAYIYIILVLSCSYNLYVS